MAKRVDRLNDQAVKKARAPGLKPDGGGLYLQVTGNGTAKSWLFRYTMQSKQRWMGLGSYPAVGLAKARSLRDEARKILEAGKDPLLERREARDAATTAAKLDQAKNKTFSQSAEEFIENHKAGWRNAKHAKQWRATLGRYAYPVIGDTPVGEVDTDAVLKVLQPIWATKITTAARVRQRIKMILSAAKVRGDRKGENPAQWRGHLDMMLPKPNKVRKPKHHEAVPYAELPTLYNELRGKSAVSAQALAFTILTAARSNEVRGATWDEIHLGRRAWAVPGDRKKSGEPFRVPLSAEAIATLESVELSPRKRTGLIFRADGRTTPLSENTMRKLLQEEMGRTGKTVHGFRSSFRDWAAEQTGFSREVAELALSHAVGDETERAGARSDQFEKRPRLMDAWASFCATPRGEVVRLRRSKKQPA